MSRWENLRQWWRESDANSKNWTKEQYQQSINDTRVFYGFVAGFLLAAFFGGIIPPILLTSTMQRLGAVLFYSAIIAAFVLIERWDVRNFKERYFEEEAAE